MDKLRDLADALHKRVIKLKEAANNCESVLDRYARGIRADEAERCAYTIDTVLQHGEEGVRK